MSTDKIKKNGLDDKIKFVKIIDFIQAWGRKSTYF